MVKNLPSNAGDFKDTGSILESGRSPRGGNRNPLQYSCLENSTDRGALRATVHGVTKSQVQRVRTKSQYKESEQRVSTKSLSILRADRVSPTARYRNESFKSLIGMYSTVPSLEMDYSVFNFMFHLMNIFKLSFLYLTEIH